MSQGPLCPNLTQKVQREVAQMANRNFSCAMLLGGLSVNLNHLIKKVWTDTSNSMMTKSMLVPFVGKHTSLKITAMYTKEVLMVKDTWRIVVKNISGQEKDSAITLKGSVQSAIEPLLPRRQFWNTPCLSKRKKISSKSNNVWRFLGTVLIHWEYMSFFFFFAEQCKYVYQFMEHWIFIVLCAFTFLWNSLKVKFLLEQLQMSCLFGVVWKCPNYLYIVICF